MTTCARGPAAGARGDRGTLRRLWVAILMCACSSPVLADGPAAQGLAAAKAAPLVVCRSSMSDYGLRCPAPAAERAARQLGTADDPFAAMQAAVTHQRLSNSSGPVEPGLERDAVGDAGAAELGARVWRAIAADLGLREGPDFVVHSPGNISRMLEDLRGDGWEQGCALTATTVAATQERRDSGILFSEPVIRSELGLLVADVHTRTLLHTAFVPATWQRALLYAALLVDLLPVSLLCVALWTYVQLADAGMFGLVCPLASQRDVRCVDEWWCIECPGSLWANALHGAGAAVAGGVGVVLLLALVFAHLDIIVCAFWSSSNRMLQGRKRLAVWVLAMVACVPVAVNLAFLTSGASDMLVSSVADLRPALHARSGAGKKAAAEYGWKQVCAPPTYLPHLETAGLNATDRFGWDFDSMARELVAPAEAGQRGHVLEPECSAVAADIDTLHYLAAQYNSRAARPCTLRLLAADLPPVQLSLAYSQYRPMALLRQRIDQTIDVFRADGRLQDLIGCGPAALTAPAPERQGHLEALTKHVASRMTSSGADTWSRSSSIHGLSPGGSSSLAGLLVAVVVAVLVQRMAGAWPGAGEHEGQPRIRPGVLQHT